MKLEQIRVQYNRRARWYDFHSKVLDLVGVGSLRRKIFSQAGGKILEVAVGNGRNFRYYPQSSTVFAVDISQAMLGYAEKRAKSLGLGVELKVADAQYLPFTDQSFDTVTSSLSSCTFPDPIKVLQEMRRVCRPSGQILLLEHGRSNLNWVARRQDHKALMNGPNYMNCHPNRNPEELAKRAGLKIASIIRPFWGYLYLIRATP